MIKSLVMMLVAMVFIWGNFARAVDYDFDPPDIPDPPDIDRPSISDIDRSGGFTSFDSPDRVDYPKHRTYDYDTRRSYPYPRDYDRRGL